jgi:methionyl-tRNA formyltransferase
LMVRALSELERSPPTYQPQPMYGVTYAAKLTNAETRIDWSRPTQAVHDHIRGLSPFPGAWCELVIDGKPTRLKVLRTTLAAGSAPPGTLVDDALAVACGEGAVRILELQRAGGKAMKAEDFLRGQSLPRGTRLT